MSRRWAICQYYEPFVLGGTVYQWRRFEVKAKDVKLVRGFKGFVFQDKLTDEFRVHELVTGGLLGCGHNRAEAVFDANKNIKETPDLKEQMAALGDTTRFKVVKADEALRRIANKHQTVEC